MDAGAGVTRVFVLYTGGTLGMRPVDPNNPASPLVPASRAELAERLAGLCAEEGIHWEMGGLTDEEGRELPPLDSADLSAYHWIRMAAALEQVYPDYDGFVVLHGTDTMAYTASALSFLLVNLGKPVVLTGAQRPVFSTRTDARQNFVNALFVAGYRATGLPLVPEVVIGFGDALLRGNRTRKVSTTAWQGFASPNYPALGSLGETIRIHPEHVRPVPEGPFYVHRKLEDQVLDITLFPGMQATHLSNLLELPELSGVVLRTFGTGNAPGGRELLEVIGRAASEPNGKTILTVTQCIEGMVELGLYASSSALLEDGVIGGFDLTPEAALAKLMWILANYEGHEVRTQLMLDQRGEQSLNMYELDYPAAGRRHDPVPVAGASARPAGPISRARLRKAVLRIYGLGLSDTRRGEELELRVFLNASGITPETPPDDVRCAGVIRQTYQGPGSTLIIADLTPGVRRLMDEERPFQLTLTAGRKHFWYRRMELALAVSAH
ncbi:MAG: asparaginase [Candidatus Eremiobacterota bacterium]